MTNLMSPIYKDLPQISKKSGQRAWGLTGELLQNIHTSLKMENSSQEYVGQEMKARHGNDDTMRHTSSPLAQLALIGVAGITPAETQA